MSLSLHLIRIHLQEKPKMDTAVLCSLGFLILIFSFSYLRYLMLSLVTSSLKRLGTAFKLPALITSYFHDRSIDREGQGQFDFYQLPSSLENKRVF